MVHEAPTGTDLQGWGSSTHWGWQTAKSRASLLAVWGELLVTNALDKATPVPREAEETASSRITVPESTALLWGHEKLIQCCPIHL